MSTKLDVCVPSFKVNKQYAAQYYTEGEVVLR